MSKDILSELTKIEIKILPELEKTQDAESLAKKTGLKDIEVQRGLQWLANKELAKLEKQETEVILLDKNGQEYLKKGLPEKQVLKIIEKEPKTRTEILKSISNEELNASIGQLKRNKAINIHKDKDLVFEITPEGKKHLQKETDEEKLLKKEFPLTNLNKEETQIAKNLLSRKGIIKKDKKTSWKATITEKGKQIAKQLKNSETEYEDKLTPEMLRTGSWKNKTFRAYDIKSKVPRIERGRKHFVNESIEYIRRMWLELGFEEMRGTKTQSAFWDLDALFVPQDHPAREEQDTFYLKTESKLPKEFKEKVKKVHENGADTGSKGWETQYSEKIAKKTLLRTHTTVLSAQTISKLKKEDLPKKFFSVNRVYRNEAMDWKHLFEFNQVEGIVVDPDANMAKLKGYLKEFFSKMGYTDVRIRPAYFPYTEPSAEVEAYNPHKKQWVEIGGCGIFRPEVTKTLMGFECPVLAWGLGMERIIATYFDIKDIRDLYRNDLKQLKTIKSFMK